MSGEAGGLLFYLHGTLQPFRQADFSKNAQLQILLHIPIALIPNAAGKSDDGGSANADLIRQLLQSFERKRI